jgi:hypothetical protein
MNLFVPLLTRIEEHANMPKDKIGSLDVLVAILWSVLLFVLCLFGPRTVVTWQPAHEISRT